MKNRFKNYLLIGLSVAAIVTTFCLDPIVQDPAFHNFADGREIASIPNFWNVISNIPFVVIGTAGLWMSVNSRPNDVRKPPGINCVVFFTGIVLTGVGSAYYHLHPNNSTLIWDRLPMTISFMSFFSLLAEKTIDESFGKKMLGPALAMAGISIIYWVWQNDLRIYVLVQFLPMILTPVILLMFPAGKIKTYFWMVVGAYAAAKIFEAADVIIFNELKFLSGHSIKHFFAALAPLFLLLAIRKKIL
jgi:hypothetical protein